MRNKTFTRIVCLLLAVMCLVSSAAVAVGAAGTEKTVQSSNLTDKTIADYADTLDTISYESYQTAKFPNAATAASDLNFSLTENWVFENGEIKIEWEENDDHWKMTVSDKNGTTIYDTLEEAEAAGYEKEDLAYVYECDGVQALYTPSIGSVTWTLDLAEKNITSATLFSIALNYYPVIAKSSSIEREFYINGKAPFSEARSLRLVKIWSSYQQGSTVGEGGSVKKLTATYTLTKSDDLETIRSEASAANLTYTVSEDQKSITVERPEVYTAAISAFIEKYGLRFFTTDVNRNELRPAQLQDPDWVRYILSDSDGYTHNYGTYDSNYFGFVLTPDENGEVKLTLTSVNEPMAISDIELLKYEGTISYEDYYKQTVAAVGNAAGSDKVLKIEAENTTHTSTNVVYPVEDRASAYTSPADTTRTLLNTIGTEKWATSGQWAEYSFMVDSDGWYDIYARFKQSYLDGMYVNRAMTIRTALSAEAFQAKFQNAYGYYDGLPFAEASQLRYNYGTDWQVTKLSSTGNQDESYQVYFRAGVVYTIRFEVTLGSMSDTVREIERILNVLNQAYLDIIKLTGTTPDDYRDYSFYRLLPDTLSNMNSEKKSLRAISDQLRNDAKVASTYTGICDKLVDLLERMLVDGGSPIAKNLDTYKSYVGSLGTFLSDAKTQPLQLDYITIQTSASEAPKDNPNFFIAFWHELMSFIQSFFRDYNSMGATETDTAGTESVSVWVPYGRDQANVIRNLSTNGFTQEYGISVNLKLVNGGTLLPSILAGMGPDVYLGLDQATIINYAIRGALSNLETMEGFDEIMMLDKPESERIFNEAATTVLKIADADGDEHYYGLPETQGFSMMFVRLDVLNSLNIEIPKTWDDIYVAQSVLQSNNMEIGVSADYKFFLYQMGGNLWADGGMRINLDSEVGLSAFNKMCDMFTQYSFPYQYDAANRFRTGEMPIIIAGYTGLYNQLKVFATELDGCWTFVPVPGWEHEDGTINNDSISSVTAVVMINAAKNKSAAWKYMCWYTGAECQADYANEMVAIMGDSAKHSTANRDALISMPWTYDEYTEVLRQFDNLASIENYPGYYFVDRYTNFAFLSAYNDGADPSTELLSYINTINTEIIRKREEFGLETLELGQKLPTKRMNQVTEAIRYLNEKYDNSVYKEAIESAKYAIANANADKPSEKNILQIEEAAALFAEILDSKWDKTMISVTKVDGLVVEKPSYYVNVGKQTMEQKDGGYRIDSLNELQLVYFISEALTDAAEALDSYLLH